MRFKQKAFALLILLLFCHTWAYNCATADCLECFGPAANQCLRCVTTKVLEDYTCKATCSVYALANADKICKNTVYDTDNPCLKG